MFNCILLGFSHCLLPLTLICFSSVWSSGAATIDSLSDFQNPWGSGSPAGPPPDSFGSSDGGWADFSSFETNFSSSTQLNDGKKAKDSSELSSDEMPGKEDTDGLFCSWALKL